MFELWYEIPGTSARSFFGTYEKADEVLAGAIAQFGLLELDRVRILERTQDGAAPEKITTVAIKLCAACETPFIDRGGRLCSRQHSKRAVLEAYGAHDSEDL